jgi:NAD+ kinase
MIGVVGGEAEAITAALEATGASVRAGAPEQVLGGDLDALVAAGAPVLSDLLRDRPVPEMPVLVVDAGEGFPGTDGPAAAAADLGAGRYTTIEYPVFGVAVGGEHVGNAVLDTMVVTSDPGRISEFRITSDAELGAVRADGVVVATPAGSHGYARSAGGPRLRRGSGVAAVVPVAAFTMTLDRWVVELDATIEIASERDVPVSLLLDDERMELRPECTVTVTASDTVDLVSPGAGE